MRALISAYIGENEVYGADIGETTPMIELTEKGASGAFLSEYNT